MNLLIVFVLWFFCFCFFSIGKQLWKSDVISVASGPKTKVDTRVVDLDAGKLNFFQPLWKQVFKEFYIAWQRILFGGLYFLALSLFLKTGWKILEDTLMKIITGSPTALCHCTTFKYKLKDFNLVLKYTQNKKLKHIHSKFIIKTRYLESHADGRAHVLFLKCLAYNGIVKNKTRELICDFYLL